MVALLSTVCESSSVLNKNGRQKMKVFIYSKGLKKCSLISCLLHFQDMSFLVEFVRISSFTQLLFIILLFFNQKG